MKFELIGKSIFCIFCMVCLRFVFVSLVTFVSPARNSLHTKIVLLCGIQARDLVLQMAYCERKRLCLHFITPDYRKRAVPVVRLNKFVFFPKDTRNKKNQPDYRRKRIDTDLRLTVKYKRHYTKIICRYLDTVPCFIVPRTWLTSYCFLVHSA